MNTEESILRTREKKKEFAKSIAGYISTHPHFVELEGAELVALVVYTMTQDIGIGQAYLDVIGVDIDLYNYDFGEYETVSVVLNSKEIVESSDGEFIKHRLEEGGIDYRKEFSKSYDPDTKNWTFVQKRAKEVNDGDRTEGTPAGGDHAALERENPVRRDRVGEDSDDPGLLLPEGIASGHLRDHDGQEAGQPGLGDGGDSLPD